MTLRRSRPGGWAGLLAVPLLLLAAGPGCGPPRADPEPGPPPPPSPSRPAGQAASGISTEEEQALRDLRNLSTALDCFREDSQPYPVRETLVPVEDRLLHDLYERYGPDLPLGDTWGNPYRYWSDGEVFLIASMGADRVPAAQFEGYLAARRRADQDTPLTRMGDDLLWFRAVGVPGGPSVPGVWFSPICFTKWPEGSGMEGAGAWPCLERHLRTRRALRGLSHALGCYAMARGSYPEQRELGPVSEALVAELHADTSMWVSAYDGYDWPIYYWSDGRLYFLLSTDRDRPERLLEYYLNRLETASRYSRSLRIRAGEVLYSPGLGRKRSEFLDPRSYLPLLLDPVSGEQSFCPETMPHLK